MSLEDDRHDDGVQDTDEVREFRLEGLGLLLVSAIMLAALSGAFYLGRWYESRTNDPSNGAAAELAALPGADAETRTKVVSATGGLTAFDTVEGDVVGEPRREARSGDRADRPTAEGGRTSTPASDTPKPPPVVAPWTVQVAAVRERQSAEQLFAELDDKGFEVRIDTIREGSDTIFKVRVGGFSDKDAAGPTAGRLKAAGYASWVTRAD